MAKQFGNMWLSRDGGMGEDNVYNLTKRRPHNTAVGESTMTDWIADVVIPARVFHELTPTRLKPGEGPMRAKITIEI